MEQQIPFPLSILLMLSPVIIIIIWSLIQDHLRDKKFKLENSRQFVMKVSTAVDHDIKKDGDGYVTMTYYGKRYQYKVIRGVEHEYKYLHNYTTKYYTEHYFILEKLTDEQPPHYYEMKKMREKEQNNDK